MSDVYLSNAATHDHIPGCDTSCFGAETCMGSAEPILGRWVPWCVAHRGGGVTASYCAASDEYSTPCRWHPLGAFVPEEADDE